MIQLQRKYNWPELLQQHLYALRDEPFHYGKHDCCYFASNTVKLLTVQSLDIAAKFDTYTNKLGALRTLKRANCTNVLDFFNLITSEYSIPEVLCGQAQRGDLVMHYDEDRSYAAGICVGAYAAFADAGIKYVPINNILKAWHYG